MKRNSATNPLWLFLAPLIWVALLIVAGLLSQTTWGISGHPSNALIIFIVLILGAPLYGLPGIIYILLNKGTYRFHLKKISIALNLLIVIGGIGCWVWWFELLA